jgi:regulatory protein YycI of two-component signal transduction system YycFG
MDWTKAKTILIVALIVTNLVLVFTYLNQNKSFDSNEEEMQKVTIKLLKERNIFLETDIPKEHRKMPKLTVQYDKMDENAVDEQLKKQKGLPAGRQTKDDILAMTREFIEKCNLMTDNVTFDSYKKDGDIVKVSYKNCINDIAIEDSNITCTVQDGKITGFERFWLKPIETSETKKNVITATAALIKFMSGNKNNEKIHVQELSLVYWVDSGSFETESPVTDTAFPAWKISYNDDKTKYIPAWEQ